jgi:hypothetical protein
LAEGQIFWSGVDLGLEAGVAEERVSHHVWVWNRAVAWHSTRGKEPLRTGQRLCSPMELELGRLAVLILDCGVVKPSTI